jgi:methionine-rich copper-binding protein CopC
MEENMKQYLLMTGVAVMILLSACASPAVSASNAMQPTPASDAAMMANATPTVDAMMNAAPTADAMMTQPSATATAMKPAPTAEAMMNPAPTADAMMAKLPDQMMAMHFVVSSPKQGETLTKAPDLVTITFNSALATNSTASVTKDSQMIKPAKFAFDDKAVSMLVSLPMDAGDGTYLVKYTACWADKSCENGQFAFKVDSKMGK